MDDTETPTINDNLAALRDEPCIRRVHTVVNDSLRALIKDVNREREHEKRKALMQSLIDTVSKVADNRGCK